MNVIDLSDWNENVDWSRFIDHGIGGVIVKISEGRTLSELFAKNIAGAAAHGLPWGVYCFSHAQTTERAEEEAEVVIEALGALGYGAPPLGIWIDVEAPETIGQDREDVTAICSAFISTCNAAGYSAGIYASLSTLTDCINVNDLADYVPYWCAQYDDECNFYDYFPGRILQGWQFTDAFKIDGRIYDMSEWY